MSTKYVVIASVSVHVVLQPNLGLGMSLQGINIELRLIVLPLVAMQRTSF